MSCGNTVLLNSSPNNHTTLLRHHINIIIISCNWLLWLLSSTLIMQLIWIMLFFCHRFSFPWYFYSWANGEPHNSEFTSKIIALSLWCVMFLVRLFCIESILNVVLVFFPDFFPLLTIPLTPTFYGMTNHFNLYFGILGWLYSKQTQSPSPPQTNKQLTAWHVSV
jgi:hypothetical protein